MPTAQVPLPLNALESLRSLSHLASLYHDLGYPSAAPDSFEPSDIGLEGAAPLVRQATLITHLEDPSLLLQHWHFELREPLTTVSVRRVTEDFMKRPGEYLLTFSSTASHYASVQFVKPRREMREGGKSLVRLSKLTVTPSRPTAHDLSVLRAIAVRPGSSALAANARQREAFSVERVTQRFFETYARLFRHVRDVIRAENLGAVIQTSPLRTVPARPAENTPHNDDEKALHAFTQRLLGRLLFLYFIQKKGWLDGEEGYITALYQECQGRGGNFYRDALEPLYFGTLSTPDPRAPGLPTEAQVPYLNGSLFEREYPIDTILNLPNSLFDPARASAVKDDPGSILHVLNSFNFTVGESAALETDISLDPEMLGKVFENLMEKPDAAESGTFYTPRSIVQFMAEETLTRYLADHSGLPQERLLPLCADDNEMHDLSDSEARRIRDALAAVRVLDPAVGTASMLMGFLNAMIQVRRSVEARLGTEVRVGTPTTSDWKREYIQHCLYGVDIKHEAIEIARLRLWLSLVVDATDPEPLPNLEYKLMAGDGLLETVDGTAFIKTEVKFVGAQGEVTAKADEIGRLHKRFGSIHEPVQKQALRRQIQQCERELFRLNIDDRIKNLDLELTALNRQIGDARQGESARTRLVKRHAALADNLEALLAQRRKVWDEEEPLPFFLHNVHFGEVMNGKDRDGNGGFDIVLGNPPYVRHERLGKLYKAALKAAFPEVETGTADLYVYFYQKGLNLLREGGRLAYITPNKFMRAGYGEKLRGVLSSGTRVELLADFGNLPVFDAVLSPLIVIVQNAKPDGETVQMLPERILKAHIGEALEGGLPAVRDALNSFHIYARGLMAPLDAQKLTSHEWTMDDPRMLRLMDKLRTGGRPLGEVVDGEFYYGIKTGFNKAFIIEEHERIDLIEKDAKSAELIKPFTGGREIRNGRINWSSKYIILLQNSGDADCSHAWREERNEKKALAIFAETYPAVYSRMIEFKDKLVTRADQGRFWWELRACAYSKKFEEKKIIYPDMSPDFNFLMDEEGYYLSNTAYFISVKDMWLVPVLSSQLLFLFFTSISSRLESGSFRFFTQYLEQLPIPNPTPAQITALESFTDDSRLPELNELVYDLYGLNPDERALVEELTAGAYGGVGAGVADEDNDALEAQ